MTEFETKTYSDGTVANGPGPLPELSPKQQDSIFADHSWRERKLVPGGVIEVRDGDPIPHIIRHEDSTLAWALGHIDKLHEQIMYLTRTNRWMPMATAPRDGTHILWCGGTGDYCVIRWPGYKECFEATDAVWQQLPERS